MTHPFAASSVNTNPAGVPAEVKARFTHHQVADLAPEVKERFTHHHMQTLSAVVKERFTHVNVG